MTPAVRAAERGGVRFELVSYAHDPRAASFGREAVEVLGLAAEEVFKTLVTKVDGKLTVAVVPVACMLDLKALAAAAGGKRAEMAESAEVERATGYVLGGVSPLGQRKALPTIVDASALSRERVYVSAGRRGLEIALAPGDLLTLTGGRVAAIARPSAP